MNFSYQGDKANIESQTITVSLLYDRKLNLLNV